MLPIWYNNYKNLIEFSINNYLEKHFENEKNCWFEKIKEAVFYSMEWWKKIRSILALEFFLIFSWKEFEEILENSDIIKLCIAIEIFHSYSLIHDDLPAIDWDELRRWKETVWKKFWEDTWIFVWDLLNSLSFEILSEIKNPELIKLFWETSWIKWMLWWQVLDIFYEKNFDKLNLENLEEIHNKKTWELIKFSILWWIILWKNFYQDEKNFLEEEKFLEIFKKFWENIWLAFQVKDDLLDVEWTKEETWKSVYWKNPENWEEIEKKWFVYFLWKNEAKKYLNKKISESMEIIWDLNSEKLEFIVEYIWNRKK